MANDWLKQFPGAVTVCDPDGVILEMNDKAAEGYAADGGYALIGCNLFDCHSEPSRSKLKAMMDAQRENVYTIEKRGQRKLIYQTPWYQEGKYAGFVELSLVIPWEMPHFVRGG
jgi:PAS domain-containing protein